MRFYRHYPNRTLCDVLEEVRKCIKTQNYSYLPGLVEEIQSLGNRMEAALEDANDLEHNKEQLRELKKEIKELETKKKDLEDEG